MTWQRGQSAKQCEAEGLLLNVQGILKESDGAIKETQKRGKLAEHRAKFRKNHVGSGLASPTQSGSEITRCILRRQDVRGEALLPYSSPSFTFSFKYHWLRGASQTDLLFVALRLQLTTTAPSWGCLLFHFAVKMTLLLHIFSFEM